MEYLPQSTHRISPPLYCQVCTAPIEYCQWSGSFDICKKSLADLNPHLFSSLYPEISLDTLNLSPTSDLAVKESGDSIVIEAKPDEKKKKVKGSQVILKKVARSKKKCFILVQGLDSYGIIH